MAGPDSATPVKTIFLEPQSAVAQRSVAGGPVKTLWGASLMRLARYALKNYDLSAPMGRRG
jgi:hypothetical protein